MSMPAWMCTTDGCDRPAAARVGVPLLPLPAGAALGFAVVWPLAHSGATGLPACIDHVHHAIDLMLMSAQPTGGQP